VMLSYIKEQFPKWNKIPFSPEFNSVGKRSYTETRVERRGNQSTQTSVTTSGGFSLSERLLVLGGDKSFSGRPETHPIFQVISALLRSYVKKLSNLYEMPKSCLTSPSEEVKRSIRHGPSVAQGKMVNYVPFSYVKSKECDAMPNIVRKTCTKISTNVIRVIDHINSLAPSSADKAIDKYRDYLAQSYAIADEVRRRWRSSAYIPDTSQLEKAFRMVDSEGVTITLTEKILDELKSDIKNIEFRPVEKDPAALKIILDKLNEINQKRISKKEEISLKGKRQRK
jgi:hypothetical protein